MSFKKMLPIFCCLYSSLLYAAPKELPPNPPSAQTQPTAPTALPLPSPPASFEIDTDKVPPSLPSSTELTNSYEGAFIRMLVTLGGLVFLVAGTFWVLRRLGKGRFKLGAGRSINILEKRALSPKTMLYIVEVGNQKIMISESQMEVRTLTTFEEEAEEH